MFKLQHILLILCLFFSLYALYQHKTITDSNTLRYYYLQDCLDLKTKTSYKTNITISELETFKAQIECITIYAVYDLKYETKNNKVIKVTIDTQFDIEFCALRLACDSSVKKNLTKEQYVQADLLNIQLNALIKEIKDKTKVIDYFSYERAVHDYIIDTMTYSTNTKGNPHAVTTLLTEHKGICAAYAKLFWLLTNRLGYDCRLVYGVAEKSHSQEEHLWNAIIYKENIYFTDITWDDTKDINKRKKYYNRSIKLPQHVMKLMSIQDTYIKG